MIQKLRYFLVVTETLSLRQAAEILHVSTAALSKSIKNLESELRIKLFYIDGRNLKLTDEATALLPKFRQLVDYADSITAHHAELAPRTLRLATFEVFSTYFLKVLMKDKVFREIPFELHELIPGKIEEALVNNEADFGFSYLPLPNADLRHLQVTEIEMGIYAHKSLQKTAFENLPFAIPISPLKGTPTKVQGLDGWPEDKFPRQVRYRVTLMESALELCRSGLAVCYLPSFIVRLHNRAAKDEYQLLECPLPANFKKQKAPVYLIYRKSRAEDSVMRSLAKALRSLSS